MNPFPILFNNKTAAGLPSFMNADTYLGTLLTTGNYYPPRAEPEIAENADIQLASVLAHEVRNPLTNINLSVEMLQSAIKNNHELQVYLDIIMRGSSRINELVNQLLKHQEADKVKPGRHSVRQLLDEVLEMTEDRITLKNISVTKIYTKENCKITLNAPKMKIALTNIIVNAIDAMTTKNGRLKLVTKSIGDKYVIKIEDNGCGISQKNLKNIFKPYYTNKPGGLGLGLAATHEILKTNHIRVNVESEKGRGTRFILVLDKSL